MIIKKIIEVGIDVQNCINLFTDEENIKNIIIDRFEKKCLRRCYIKSVDRIMRRGECIINQDGSPDFGTIPMIIETTAVEYAVGEIINGCKVITKHKNGIIICQTDIASIMLNAHKSLESIQIGQYISVRVGSAKYSLITNKISINAVPFLFTKAQVAYKVNNSKLNTELFQDVLERIRKEEEAAPTLNAKARETFNQLLYAYKEEPKNLPKTVDLVAIATTGIIEAKYISRDSRINGSTANAFVYADPPDEAIVRGTGSKVNALAGVSAIVSTGDKAGDTEVKVDPYLTTENVILSLLEDYCSHLRTVREMVETYSTPELIASHNNLWLLFKKSKF